MKKEYYIKQLDSVLTDYSHIKSKARYEDLSGNTTIEELSALLTKAKASVERICGKNSEYYRDVEKIFNDPDYYDGAKLQYIAGIIMALKGDLENDYLKSIQDIIQSEIFSDYLDMAEHLEKEGYKDPATVLVGSTLEEHLRELCKSNSIDIEVLNRKEKLIPKKASVMNSDLAKKGVYTSAYQKQITAWLDLRNSAAHGHFDKYSPEEVRLMLQGVRQLILSTK